MNSKTGISTCVKEEVKHIQKGLDGSAQNMLREYYVVLRQHDLSTSSKTKNETFKKALDSVRKENPNFVPKYDHDYFQLSNS
jgi:hypothetical protein